MLQIYYFFKLIQFNFYKGIHSILDLMDRNQAKMSLLVIHFV